MASQRLFIATFAGEAAAVVTNLFRGWRATAVDVAAVDGFCAAIRSNATALPIVYFSEWLDRWQMGDLVPGPGSVNGRRFQTTAFTRDEALDWASRCGNKFQEERWLTARLREAADAWNELVDRVVVVIIREVLGGLTTDEEIQASLRVVPSWLSRAGAEPGAAAEAVQP